MLQRRSLIIRHSEKRSEIFAETRLAQVQIGSTPHLQTLEVSFQLRNHRRDKNRGQSFCNDSPHLAHKVFEAIVRTSLLTESWSARYNQLNNTGTKVSRFSKLY